jgi:hypothetical protein
MYAEIKEYNIPSFYGISYLREEYKEEEKLEQYFNDLFKFFLYTFSNAIHRAKNIDEVERRKIITMAQEIISVKNILEEKE